MYRKPCPFDRATESLNVGHYGRADFFLLSLVTSPFKPKSRLEAENAALKQQLIVLQRKVSGCVQFTNNDRLFFIQGIYGASVTRRLRAMGIRDKPIAAGSPWQNPYVERLIGTIRRECLDHMIVFGEAHLRRIVDKYNVTRIHRALNKDAPFPRAIERLGVITSRPILGGLHHQYCRI